MESKIRFGKWETILIMINLVCMQILLSYPRTMVEIGGTAGWILPIYSTIIIFIFYTIIVKLMTRFEGMDLLDISEIAAGKSGRLIVGTITLVYLVTIISLILREFGEDMKTIALVNSPISFIMLFFLVGMICGAFAGIEAIVRLAAIFVPVVSVGYYFIIFAVAPYFDSNALMPILGNGVNSVFLNGLVSVSNYSAIYIMFFIAPFIGTIKNFKNYGYAVIVISGINLTTSVLFYLSAFPYPTALESSHPIYQLARLINYGRFFQRVEAVFVLIWAISAFIYLSFGFFFILQIFRKTFQIKYYRPLIIPIAILVFNISIIPQSLMTTLRLEITIFRRYIWIVTLVLPIVVLVIARYRFSRGKRSKVNA